MSLAIIANVPNLQDENTFHEFSFSNADSHMRIVRAIRLQMGISLNIYILDPMPFFDIGAAMYNHQQMHNDMNGVTGVRGVDLSSVDWNDEEQAVNFIRLHLSEHQQNEQRLRISA